MGVIAGDEIHMGDAAVSGIRYMICGIAPLGGSRFAVGRQEDLGSGVTETMCVYEMGENGTLTQLAITDATGLNLGGHAATMQTGVNRWVWYDPHPANADLVGYEFDGASTITKVVGTVPAGAQDWQATRGGAYDPDLDMALTAGRVVVTGGTPSTTGMGLHRVRWREGDAAPTVDGWGLLDGWGTAENVDPVPQPNGDGTYSFLARQSGELRVVKRILNFDPSTLAITDFTDPFPTDDSGFGHSTYSAADPKVYFEDNESTPAGDIAVGVSDGTTYSYASPVVDAYYASPSASPAAPAGEVLVWLVSNDGEPYDQGAVVALNDFDTIVTTFVPEDYSQSNLYMPVANGTHRIEAGGYSWQGIQLEQYVASDTRPAGSYIAFFGWPAKLKFDLSTGGKTKRAHFRAV